MRWKITGAVVIAGVSVVIFLFVLSPPLAVEVLCGDTYGAKCDVRGLLRRNEVLPVILIENGKTAYCRMRYCDFRFPLPASSRVVQAKLTEGGPDTVDGFIDVQTTNGTPMDSFAYTMDLKSYPLAEGGSVSTVSAPDGPASMRIKFSYFGDY